MGEIMQDFLKTEVKNSSKQGLKKAWKPVAPCSGEGWGFLWTF
jgi:hypothetical protein